MRKLLGILSAVVFSSAAWATMTIQPNTTLAAETSNNTSAANSFVSQKNGNLGASNISKVSLKNYLYPGYTGKLYVHFMPWFGGASHINVGYTSDDATQVARQVNDMMSRGIDGAIVDWYGPERTSYDHTTKLLMAQAAQTGGQFQFAITEDVGALNACATTAGCDVTGKMINDLNYVYNTYEQSPDYIRFNGRPVVFFFGVEQYTIDWTRVQANVLGNPILVQRNANTFANSTFQGAYAWIQPSSTDPTDIAYSYLDYFYQQSLKYPTKAAFGTGYKGFNDTIALWSANRIMNQNCGQTLVNSLAEISKYYNASKQLFAVQLATWNDYEEGSELETGVDNCVSITGSASGTTVNWSITGSASMVDHYTVFISTDGVNLMNLGDVPSAQRSYSFSGYGLAAGTYKVFVKAVGAPSMLNHMSSAITMTVPNQTPVAALSLSKTTGTAPVAITASNSASYDNDGTIAKRTIDFGDGTVVSATSSSHTYSTAGTYTVKVTVTDNLGASSTAQSAVTIYSAVALKMTSALGSQSGSRLRLTAYNTKSADMAGSTTSTKRTVPRTTTMTARKAQPVAAVIVVGTSSDDSKPAAKSDEDVQGQ